MAYIPCKIGGGTEKATLLWTNPNPTSNSFSRQTVTLNGNINDYEYITFKVRNRVGDNPPNEYEYTAYITRPILKDYVDTFSVNFSGKWSSLDSSYVFARFFKVISSTSKVEISQCYNSYGPSMNNNNAVPLEIYGHKKPIFNL